jgi:small subunit ribosomal protein S3
MGQKIHPTGFRLSVLKNWSSKWYANRRNFPVMLHEDIKVREYLKKKLAHASVGRVIIERPSKNARFTIYTSRPGIVIGKKGEDIEVLRGELQKRMGVPVHVNIEEIRKPEIDAQLIADNIAQQLEKRIMFRRAMKRAIQNAMRLGAKGIKIMCAGRLNGIEIARSEWYREGRVPLHTLRADVDYGTSEAQTTYGAIGVKVWVFKGEVMGPSEQPATIIALPDRAPESELKKKRPASKPETKKPKIATATKPAEQAEGKTVSKKKASAKKITKSPAKADKKPTKKAEKPTKIAVKPAAKSTTKAKKTVKKPGAKDAATS